MGSGLYLGLIDECRKRASDPRLREHYPGYEAKALASLGALYARTGDRRKAEDVLATAERLHIEVFGAEHPETKALQDDVVAFRSRQD
jgi:hypothetical protein